MRIETEGRSEEVPHFARRLCLLVRQTCGKIARGTLFQFLAPVVLSPCNNVAEIDGDPQFYRVDLQKRAPDEENMRITIFPRHIRTSFSTSAHLSMHSRWSDARYNMRMTHQNRPAPALLKSLAIL